MGLILILKIRPDLQEYSCAGSPKVSGNVYRTVWANSESRYYAFVKDALLKLIEVDCNTNTIGFFNTLRETKTEPASVQYTKTIQSNIITGVEFSKSRCSESITMSIEEIINNVECL